MMVSKQIRNLLNGKRDGRWLLAAFLVTHLIVLVFDVPLLFPVVFNFIS